MTQKGQKASWWNDMPLVILHNIREYCDVAPKKKREYCDELWKRALGVTIDYENRFTLF